MADVIITLKNEQPHKRLKKPLKSLQILSKNYKKN